MTKFSSRVLAAGVALVLAQSALAQDKPEAKDAPTVRTDVRVKKNEQQVVKKEVTINKNEAEIEKKLEAARERLEEAAREVADLSAQLTGPVMHDYVMKHGKSRAVLGINVGDTLSTEGVSIDSVSPNGAAAKAGLKAGDIITALDGMSLKVDKDSKDSHEHGETARRKGPVSALIRHMRTVTPGEKVQVEYLRDGKKLETEVMTEELKAPRFTYAIPAVPAVPAVPPIEAMPGRPQAWEVRAFPGMHDMELVTLTPKLGAYFGADKGVLVVRAPKAADFKLEEGDVIVDIDGRAPESGTHALRILRSYQPGEKISLSVLRNRKKMKLDASVPKPEKMSWEIPLPSFSPGDLEDIIEHEKEIDREVRPKVKALTAPAPQ
jgi:S1-C subfamily serine protease